MQRSSVGAFVLLSVLGLHSPAGAQAQALASAAVSTESADGAGLGVDGVVEAVRQSTLASQVAGTIVSLPVHAGEHVRAGQVLLRLDARVVFQEALASAAQADAAQAALELARKDYARQKSLFAQDYISQAALDRATAALDARQAQAQAAQAQAQAVRSQSDQYLVRAPYAGIVSAVAVALGDMATPGKPLLTLYDPSAMRVTATVPESAQVPGRSAPALQVQFGPAGADSVWIPATQQQWLPAVDPTSHTLALRLQLANAAANYLPGTFARVWLPTGAPSAQRLLVPAAAVVRRAEMTGVYVLSGNLAPQLRQVRLGALQADGRVEVLAGLHKGERIALDPQAAAKEH